MSWSVCLTAVGGILSLVLGTAGAVFYAVVQAAHAEDYISTWCTIDNHYLTYVDFQTKRGRSHYQGYRAVWLIDWRCPTDEGQGVLMSGNITDYPVSHDTVFDTPEEALEAAEVRLVGSSDTCWCRPNVELSPPDIKSYTNNAVVWDEPFIIFPTAASGPIAFIGLPLGLVLLLWTCYGRRVMRSFGRLGSGGSRSHASAGFRATIA